MLIGELANRTGCTRDTIRFYEKIGLLEGRADARSGNRYKHYAGGLVDRILLVKQAKLLGLTLAEIRQLMQAWEKNLLSRQDKIRIFSDKIGAVDRKIAELRRVRAYLEAKLKQVAKPKGARSGTA